MRQINYARILPAVCICLVLILSLGSCEEDTGVQAPQPVGPIEGGYDPVFNADGGFVITYGMLDKRYNEITFPGTHNSVATYGSDGACQCQELTIWQQLDNGIRFIDLDVNGVLWSCHGACVYHNINTDFNAIKAYAKAHPHQVITVRISDLRELSPADSYERINGRLEPGNTDLGRYIYNWDPTVEKSSLARCYIPDPWPTLREMIDSGKNVMFLHNENVTLHNIIDEGLFESLNYASDKLGWFYEASDLQDLCKLTPRWEPPRWRQHDNPYRLFLAECEPDYGAWAGDRRFASRNNDGRKLYQLAKHTETEVLPAGRAVNFIIIDYFAYTTAGRLPIDIVDACNRMNYERFGIDWESSEGFWELYPYEFDDTRVELITQTSSLKYEVEEVFSDFYGKLDLGPHASAGKIVSTSYQTDQADWTRIPEWAVDDDFFTRWCGENNNPDHAWGIDLGEPRAVDEIAIAWEYPHHRPGYKVYASNDDSKFADGISQTELADDSGWTLVVEEARVAGGEVLLWDQKPFQDTGISNWRYIKVKVTDTGEYEWPTFYELRLYGPAN
jgi:hypothetical protein